MPHFQVKCCHPDCNEEFRSRMLFYRHILTGHLPKDDNKKISYICQGIDCPLKFTDNKRFFQHYYEHVKRGDISTTCLFRDCHFKPQKGETPMEKLLQNHISLKHRQKTYHLLKGYKSIRSL